MSHTFEDDLGPFVGGAIDGRRTTLRTDGLDGYRPLAAAGIPNERFVRGADSVRGVRLLPWSHAVFSNRKSWFRGTYQGASHKYLPRYLDESSFRFNHRGAENAIGRTLLARAFWSPPCPYRRLTEELTG